MKTYNYIYNNKNDFLCNLDKFDRFSKNIFIQVFSWNLNKFDLDDLRRELVEIFPYANISWTTTDWEIIWWKVTKNQIIISISIFENTLVKTKMYSFKNSNSLSIFKKIQKDLITSDTKVLILFSDWVNDIEWVLWYIYKNYPNIHVSGWKSWDNYNFINPYIFDKDKISNSWIIITSLSNKDLQVYTNYNFSWTKIWKQMIVTKAYNKRIYELNNMPVSQVYEKYLWKIIADQLPKTWIQFPLIINRDWVDVARDVLKKFDDWSLLLAWNIKNWDVVNFWCGNTDDILSWIFNIIDNAVKIPIESIFLYSCTARKNFLWNEIIEEILPISKIYNTVGFFTYWEFFHTNSWNEVLNETLTFLCLSETNNIKTNNIDKLLDFVKNKQITTNKERNSYFALSHLVKVTNWELKEANESLLEWNKNLEQKIITTTNKIKSQKDKYFEWYKSIIDNSNEMICIIDKNKSFLYTNKQFQVSVWYNQDELQKMLITDIFQTTDSVMDIKFDCNNKKMKLITKDMTLINVLVTKFEFLDEWYTVIIKNLEEIIKLEESYNKLLELDKKKDDFLNIASHELRTPMTTIKWYLSMMMDGDIWVVDESAKKYLKIVLKDSDRLINLINDMLDISKIESWKMIFNYEKIDLKKFIENLIFDMQLNANFKWIKINKNIEYDNYYFNIDKQRLKQVLINVIWNAIKFTPENWYINIDSYIDGKKLYILVKDSWIWIHKWDLSKIFEKFVQISNSLSREAWWSWLWLPIALNIVKKFKWDIQVESKIWEWTTFKIILPL